MQILSIRRLQASGADARFDIAITDQLRLFGLCLTKNADGAWRTYAPRNSGVRVASFHPSLADQITRAAVAALEGEANVGR
ncbi:MULTISPECIES: hypothetical protein [unclassified Mesorhizobium]|uniref:hypothetical protein n=1 Tax=unclassified Mesorhizobium TaxID=325217 RepID=UPI001092CE50|nr:MULTISPECIES: hypothetical protein [unclassified Mesorhizobium]TGP88920.1 hypothetical protein EN861_27050 [Mesorhizobium sp. M8A.F.Ca.ET.218.01.1.1]TGT16080.1 hypothetical protein EN856_26585 [Mesorhizobium sp. M8A.F.Ca.ET.213.01.1.1]